MKEELMNWTREDQVKWVANEIRVADREYYAYEKEHGKDNFLGMLGPDDSLPEDLQKRCDRIAEYPKDIYQAAVQYNRYLENIDRFGKLHQLYSLRVMLEAEHSYYELPGKDLEKFTDKLIDRADQEMNLHGEW